MKELLTDIRELVANNINDIKEITALDGIETMFVFELENGKRYALSLIELN